MTGNSRVLFPETHRDSHIVRALDTLGILLPPAIGMDKLTAFIIAIARIYGRSCRKTRVMEYKA